MTRLPPQAYAGKLAQRGVNRPCPRCGHLHFSVLGEGKLTVAAPPGSGLLNQLLPPVLRDLPIVVLGCSNCGYITQHSTAVLDGEQ
jgi:hypothetical protein